MRLFVAVDVPPDVKDALERDVVEPLRSALRGASFSRPEGRHLTLKFLGEVADERVVEVESALAAAPASGAFDASLDVVGGFPNLRRPRVLWVGADPLVRLAALASRVDDALEPLGFEREQRAFTAHLTLARFRAPAAIGELPRVDVPAALFRVSEYVLFRSELHPRGARYTALRRFPA